MILGQNPTDRTRFAYIRSAPPGADARISTRSFTPKDWVTATGGGYFFAPSVSAVRDVLGG
jgi:hypothetical protein